MYHHRSRRWSKETRNRFESGPIAVWPAHLPGGSTPATKPVLNIVDKMAAFRRTAANVEAGSQIVTVNEIDYATELAALSRGEQLVPRSNISCVLMWKGAAYTPRVHPARIPPLRSIELKPWLIILWRHPDDQPPRTRKARTWRVQISGDGTKYKARSCPRYARTGSQWRKDPAPKEYGNVSEAHRKNRVDTRQTRARAEEDLISALNEDAPRPIYGTRVSKNREPRTATSSEVGQDGAEWLDLKFKYPLVSLPVDSCRPGAIPHADGTANNFY